MNLQSYANHRKSLGLRGQSHVAVLKAINEGRLSSPAVERQGRGWVIDPVLADAQWAGRTDPTGAPQAPNQDQPTATGEPAAATRSGPPLSVSKQVKAAYDAKMAELDYKAKAGQLVLITEVKAKAFALARSARDGLLGIPDRISPVLAATSDVTQVHHLLTEEINLALRVLSDA